MKVIISTFSLLLWANSDEMLRCQSYKTPVNIRSFKCCATALNFVQDSEKPCVTALISKNDPLSYFSRKPFKQPISWEEVVVHVGDRMKWENQSLNLAIEYIEDKNLTDKISSDIVLLINIRNVEYFDIIRSITESATVISPFDSADQYYHLTRFGTFRPNEKFDYIRTKIDKFLKNERSKDRQAYEIALETWARRSSGDILFMILVLIDRYYTPVPSVQTVTSTDVTGLEQVCR